MISFLKNHPFAVEAFFESSLVLTYAVPKEKLQNSIPQCLTLDTFQDKWAFVAVALVQTRALRPKGFPKVFGNDFFLIGYRIFVRYTSTSGKRLRGLFILKSQTDKKKMTVLGNAFTKYQYTTTDVTQSKTQRRTLIKSIRSNFAVEVEEGEDIMLPQSSPFQDWKEARRFAGPLPFTFSCNPKEKHVLIVEGVRQNWRPAPVKVISHNFSFLYSSELNGLQLASAFMVTNTPYYWKKGKTEKCSV